MFTGPLCDLEERSLGNLNLVGPKVGKQGRKDKAHQSQQQNRKARRSLPAQDGNEAAAAPAWAQGVWVAGLTLFHSVEN